MTIARADHDDEARQSRENNPSGASYQSASDDQNGTGSEAIEGQQGHGTECITIHFSGGRSFRAQPSLNRRNIGPGGQRWSGSNRMRGHRGVSMRGFPRGDWSYNPERHND